MLEKYVFVNIRCCCKHLGVTILHLAGARVMEEFLKGEDFCRLSLKSSYFKLVISRQKRLNNLDVKPAKVLKLSTPRGKSVNQKREKC